MDFLFLQSDYFGQKVKAISYFIKLLEDYPVNVTYLHGQNETNLHSLEKWLQANNPTYILISTWCYNNMTMTMILDIIEKYSLDSIVILGSWMPNILQDKVFDLHKRIDYISLGDGEEVICELASNNPVSEIEGIYGRENNQNEFIYRKTNRELEVKIPGPSIVPMSGCGSSCKFCSINNNPQNYWSKSLKRIESEIIFQKQNKINQVYLGYDNVLVNQKKAVQYARLLKKYDMLFATTGRVDQLSESIVEELSECGCVRLDFGIESASERLSRHINKNLSISQMHEAANLCLKYNILPFAFSITGLPSENETDIKDNLNFIRNSSFLLFEVNRYKDYVGSEFSNEIINFDKLAVSKYYQYDSCFGVFHTKEDCIMSELSYRYVLKEATKAMIEKMMMFFSNDVSEIQNQAYWQSFRDATLDTNVSVDHLEFPNARVKKEFQYWWRVKKYENIRQSMHSKKFLEDRYFIDKNLLIKEGIVEPILVTEDDIEYYKEIRYKEV